MGEKDIAEKVLLSYNDVFSDIVNVLLFGKILLTICSEAFASKFFQKEKRKLKKKT